MTPDYSAVRDLTTASSPVLTVVGPHSSGTRAHVQLCIDLVAANHLDLRIEHWSTPSDKLPPSDFWVVVQREHDVTVRSQAKHGYGQRSYPGGGEFPGFETQVWAGIAQIAAHLADPATRKPAIHAWYPDTVRNPREFGFRVARFLESHRIGGSYWWLPASYGDYIVDGSAKYRM